MIKKHLVGWGRNLGACTSVINFEEFQERVQFQLDSEIIAFGRNRSYGDSSFNSVGLNIDMTEWKTIKIYKNRKYALCQAGATISDLEKEAIKYGLFPPVVPGTGQVTIGGAIASNIHGKSHHKFGSFGDNLLKIKLLDRSGKIFILEREGENSSLFHATLGGMGLTGIVVEAEINLIEIETEFFTTIDIKSKNFSELIENMKKLDSKYDYTVAWIDISGKKTGRGVISAGNHSKKHEIQNYDKKVSKFINYNFTLPKIFEIPLINRFSVLLFNFIWFHKPKSKKFNHYSKFLHPLDRVSNWNILYGKEGFVQYQFVIPENKISLIEEILETLTNKQAYSFLAVLKRFGPCTSKYLSFPMEGWTLAIDFPSKMKNLSYILENMDEKIIGAHGRVYITKDSRVSKVNLQEMYQELQEWKSIKFNVDPDNIWQSDQSKRLGLT